MHGEEPVLEVKRAVALAPTGKPFTSLRNGYQASAVPPLIGRALETGSIAVPADGPISWTTHDDLAEATAIVLATSGAWTASTPR